MEVKKWGNSFGVVLPRRIIAHHGITEGTKIEIFVQAPKKTKVKDVFGILKNKIVRDTDDLLKEVDKDFEGQ